MRQNLKGAMFFAMLLALRLAGDDDEKNRRKGDVISQMMGNLMFIFDPEQLKFMVKNPIAAQGTIVKFVDAINDGITGATYKADARFGDKGDLKVTGDILKLMPYNKIILNDLVMGK
jgi:hypothetical protein